MVSDFIVEVGVVLHEVFISKRFVYFSVLLHFILYIQCSIEREYIIIKLDGGA